MGIITTVATALLETMFSRYESKESIWHHDAEHSGGFFVAQTSRYSAMLSTPKLSIKGSIMKRFLAVLLAALAAITVGTPPPSKAAAVSFGVGMHINAVADFNAPLSPFGTWVSVRRFGRVWHPTRIAVGWRPYSVGSWVWTSAGWFWQSDEPWAWATYHYGSWNLDPTFGWVWIPATSWAPAWVTWRYSSAYIGWAPIGPRMTVMAPSFFMFIGANRFGSRFRPADLIINNTVIINKTRPVRNFERETVKVDGEERTIYSNKGPGVEPVEHATGETLRPRPVEDVAKETPPPQNLPGNENQRPETKPGEQPGNEALPPTGNEQHPEQAQPKPEQPPAQQPGVIPPTGGEQEHNYQPPEQKPAQPSTPEQTPPSTPPSEKTPAQPPVQQPGVIPPPSTEQNAPPQQPLPPTGRPSTQPPQAAPSTPTAPSQPSVIAPPAPTPPTAPSQPSVTPPPAPTPPQAPPPQQPLPPTGRPQQPPQSAPSAPTPPTPPPQPTPPSAPPTPPPQAPPPRPEPPAQQPQAPPPPNQNQGGNGE